MPGIYCCAVSFFLLPQLYIQARLQSEWARLLRPTIQFFLIATAVYVGLSRVSDYKHHWSDVLAGLLQGALVAVFTVSPKPGDHIQVTKDKTYLAQYSQHPAIQQSSVGASCLLYLTLPRSSTGGLRVQLFRAARGTGGVAGGGRIPHQLTRKSLQRKPLRQHRLTPGAGRQNWTHRTSSEAPLNSRRLLLCTPSSMSAPRYWRLQALAAAFAAVEEPSLPEERRTADYSTRSLLSHKAAGVACQVFFSFSSFHKPRKSWSVVE